MYIFKLLKNSAKEWTNHNPLLLGAAISFYIVLSLGPILALTLLLLSNIFDENSAQAEILDQVRNLVGEKPADVLLRIIRQASSSSNKTMAVISSIPLIFFGTTMIFFQIRNALNIIWDIKEDNGWKSKIKNYSASFLMLAVVGFFFLLLVVKEPILISIRDNVNSFVNMPRIIFHLVDILFSYAFITLLFAATYQILPKAEISSKALWMGAAVTSLLFTIVQFLVGFNASNSNIDSAFGAIGSFTILFLWIFYSALVFLFGACFTKVYSKKTDFTK